jgi:hypothetical protein
MSGTWRIALGALLCLLFLACSPPSESKKAAPAAAKDEPPPAVFHVNLDTSKGPVVIEVRREWAPRGQGPDPSQIEVQGNAYLEDHFARLDYIHKATIQ